MGQSHEKKGAPGHSMEIEATYNYIEFSVQSKIFSRSNWYRYRVHVILVLQQ